MENMDEIESKKMKRRQYNLEYKKKLSTNTRI